MVFTDTILTNFSRAHIRYVAVSKIILECIKSQSSSMIAEFVPSQSGNRLEVLKCSSSQRSRYFGFISETADPIQHFNKIEGAATTLSFKKKYSDWYTFPAWHQKWGRGKCSKKVGLSLAHRYATFLCSWDVDSLVGQLTSLSLSRIQMVTSGKREPD